MNLSRVERWILFNQFSILELIDKENAESHRHSKEAIADGYELCYDWFCPHIADGDEIVTEEESRYVLDVMDMFDFMQRAYDSLEDKSGIEANFVKFRGFDGNNESKLLGFAEFFCRARGAYPDLRKGTDGFNSHMPTYDLYRRMLTAWEESRDKHQLTKADLLRLTQAAIHPDHRK